MPSPQAAHGVPLRSFQRHSPRGALATPEQSVGSHASISKRSPPIRNAQTQATVIPPQSMSSGNQAEVASPVPQSNNQQQAQATSTINSYRWKPWLLLATDTRVISVLALIFTLAILWPTFRSLVYGEDAVALAEWTALKDYREYCKDDAATGDGQLDPDCTEILKTKLPPPPNTGRSLATRRLDPSIGNCDRYEASDSISSSVGISLPLSSIPISAAFVLGTLLFLRVVRSIVISQIWPLQDQGFSYEVDPNGNGAGQLGNLPEGQAPDAQLPPLQERGTRGSDSPELEPPVSRTSALHSAHKNSKYEETAKFRLPNPAPSDFGYDRNNTSSTHQHPRWTHHRQWFQPGEGICQEVIQAEIMLYLGPDALVKPGNEGSVNGYIITAYRALTSEMVASLKDDSRRWRDELLSRGALGTDDSTRLSGQYHGPPPSYRIDPSGALGVQVRSYASHEFDATHFQYENRPVDPYVRRLSAYSTQHSDSNRHSDQPRRR